MRTVDWAGDPGKTVVKGDGFARLSPRGSFALWKETVRGRSLCWTTLELETATAFRDGMVRLLLQRSERLAAAHSDLRWPARSGRRFSIANAPLEFRRNSSVA